MASIARAMAPHDEATQARIAEWTWGRYGTKIAGTDIRPGDAPP